MDSTIVIDILLIIHFVGLMIGAGGGIGSAIVMGYARALPPEQSGVVRGVGPSLAMLSFVGLVLMLLSGGAMVSMKWKGFGNMPDLFWVKMIFVATLAIAATTTLFLYGQAKKGNAKAAAWLPRLGPMAGISAFLATIVATLTFH